ncbi:MAG: hypothetical protein AAB804_03335 [Patescibacteria group bacterium]
MKSYTRAFITRFCIATSTLTFLGLLGIVGFEVYVRWTLNQNFSFLGADGLAGLAILCGAQMLGLVWLSRSE